MKSQRLIQTLLGAVVLTLLMFLLQLVFGTMMGQVPLFWNLLANLLIVGVLGFYIIHSGYYSYKLVFSTFAIFYIIGNFNLIIEAYIFRVVDGSIMIKSVLFGVPYTLLGSLLVVWIFGRLHDGEKALPIFESRKTFNWVWRILLANFLYVFFYIITGTLIEMSTPGFEEFYEGKLPSMVTFFITNMGFRGFVFVAIAILIDRSLNVPKWTKALFVGLVFSIIGGIAPLIPPSEEMPQFIRIAHGFEVGISNFLYGIVVLLIVRSSAK